MRLIDFHHAAMAWTAHHFTALDQVALDAATAIGWTGRELVTHLVAVNTMCTNSSRGIGPDQLGDITAVVGDDPVGAWQSTARALTAAFADPDRYTAIMPTPVGPHPGATVLTVGTLENLIHTTDLAPTRNQPGNPIPDELLTEALARIMSLAPLFDHFRTIDFYAPPRTVEPDAGPQQRLLAFLGRA
jgi:uncharacterized protein (TIGR03086 family)